MKDVTIFRTWEEPIADMAIDFLISEGINAIKISEIPRSVLPTTFDGLGEIEIRVPEDDVEKAVEIITVRFSEHCFPHWDSVPDLDTDIEFDDNDEY